MSRHFHVCVFETAGWRRFVVRDEDHAKAEAERERTKEVTVELTACWHSHCLGEPRTREA